MDPQKIFETYQDLADIGRTYGGYDIQPLHWATEEELCCGKDSDHREPVDFNNILVPAGWSDKVISAYNAGIVRLGKKLFSSKRFRPRGALCSFYVRPGETEGDKKQMAVIGFTSVEQNTVCSAVKPSFSNRKLETLNRGVPYHT
jgi:hypothetical protein